MQVINFGAEVRTMTSREIAELTGKDVGNVHRDIRSMIEGLEDDSDLNHLRSESDARGYVTCYHLNKSLSLTLAGGEPGFVGKDVAERLGYKDTINAIKQHCRGVALHHPLQTAGGMQQVRVLTEPDVMRLIVSSKLPEAEVSRAN